MEAQQWVMFIVGVILVFVGCGLIIWGYTQKRTKAGAIQDVTKLINAIAKLFNTLGNFFGPDPAMRVGGFLVIVGIGLMVGAFYLPNSQSRSTTKAEAESTCAVSQSDCGSAAVQAGSSSGSGSTWPNSTI